MKHHIMIALGLLMATIFSYRLAVALLAPGFGIPELYFLGGIVIASALIFGGLKERRYVRSLSQPDKR